MGIKNLIKLIKKYAPDAIINKQITDYKGKVLAIDFNLMIYKMVYAIRMNGYDIKNNNINVTHIHALLQKIKAFIKYDIIPIFVFDGLPPTIKHNTLDKRKEIWHTIKVKYKNAITHNEKNKFYFAKSDITQKEINDCINLLKIFNFTIIYSPQEADSQIAYLIKNGYADYAVSDDMDLLLFGCTKLLKNFTVSIKKPIQEINLIKLKKITNLSQSQLIDIGILLGCDYCPSIKGFGPITAYTKIKTYGSINNLIETKQIQISEIYNKAQQYFKNPLVTNKIKIKKLKIDKIQLILFLRKFHFTDKYIEQLFFDLKLIK
jgi:flap endonuclease-1